MSFLSCEEMLAAARNQKITLAEAVLRSDLDESRLTEEHSRRHAAPVAGDAGHQPRRPQRSRSGFPAASQGGTGLQRRKAAGRRLPVRGDCRGPQDRRVQRLHVPDRGGAHGGRLRRAAGGAAAPVQLRGAETSTQLWRRCTWPAASARSSPTGRASPAPPAAVRRRSARRPPWRRGRWWPAGRQRRADRPRGGHGAERT